MATPHLAGAAAVVTQAHPDWSAWQIRSAIVNTADTGVLTQYTDGTTPATDVNVSGTGRLNLAVAVGATALLDPVSVSFGCDADRLRRDEDHRGQDHQRRRRRGETWAVGIAGVRLARRA